MTDTNKTYLSSPKFKPIICERVGCEEVATHTIYGFGYLASVCKKHYDSATQQDRDDAIRFRYAEG